MSIYDTVLVTLPKRRPLLTIQDLEDLYKLLDRIRDGGIVEGTQWCYPVDDTYPQHSFIHIGIRQVRAINGDPNPSLRSTSLSYSVGFPNANSGICAIMSEYEVRDRASRELKETIVELTKKKEYKMTQRTRGGRDS